ncbi:gap junction delta-4 protein isoform X3 [Engraulis encrasicolus]|uniref:gap junction delta-4 protein isoform X3 n=1 Tax=Engraulis encrasicolus TaxID=184585 RepID=UPI002FD262BF
MGIHSASEIIFITLNHNITVAGKFWLISMVFLRILVLLFAGYPLYQDEQERFICNTMQPGCANVCYDLFAPFSLLRFWLIQLLVLCLPFAAFVSYVVHRVLSDVAVLPDASLKMKARSLIEIQQDSSMQSTNLSKSSRVQTEFGMLRRNLFSGAYMVQLLLRVLLEAGFGAAHYYLFGFHVPKRFMCLHSPCTTTGLDCYVSRPTEKTVMLNLMLGGSAFSLLLSFLDMLCAIKMTVHHKTKTKKMLVRNMYQEEQFYLPPSGSQADIDANLPSAHDDMLATGSFRKRMGGGGAGAGGSGGGSVRLGGKSQGVTRETSASAPHLEDALLATFGRETPGMLGLGLGGGATTTGDNSGYPVGGGDTIMDECHEREGSEVALCPTEPGGGGTPRPIRVNKRSRLKPPPPPRRDNKAPGANLPGDVGAPSVGVGAAVCTRRVGHYTLVEMSGGDLPSDSNDNQEKRSEWV